MRDLSFGIPAGECFGFLGINGAGKTSTLRMLTGDTLPASSNGNGHGQGASAHAAGQAQIVRTARLAGRDILEEQSAVRALIGYCPQFDALLDLLTGDVLR